MNKQMPPRLPTASEMVITTKINAVKNEIMGVTTEINAVEKDIKEVENKMSRVEAALVGQGVYLGISDHDTLFMALQHLRDEEKQLRYKEKQLRDEKKQLWEEEKQLRDEMLRLLPSPGKPSGWYFTPVSR